jgi:hypothetical protein
MPARKETSSDSTAIRGIESDFGHEYADTFRHDFHPALLVLK